MVLQIILGIAVVLGIYAFMWWKVFEKAGRPGAYSLIPIYNIVVLFQISGKPGWWIALAFIPYAGGIVVWIMQLIAALELSKKFGKSTGFAIGMWLLPIVFYPILGFGDAQYDDGGFQGEIDSFGTAESDPNTESDEVQPAV